MTRVTTCTRCWRTMPCEIHSRPRNASWSKDRPRAAQHSFRLAVLARDGHRCVYPGCTIHDPTGKTLIAHHDRPGYTPDCGRTLCAEHHKAVDRHAR